jgi:hypothetical protein
MSKVKKASSNDAKHPYLRGYNFWSEHRFWNTNYYTPKAKEYYQKCLAVMQAKDRVLARLDKTIL